VRAAALLLLTLSACTDAQFGSEPDTRARDAAVYRAVLDSISRTGGNQPITQLVITDSTFTEDGELTELAKVPGVDSAIMSDFRKRNAEPHSLAYLSSAAFRIPLVLVGRDNLHSFLQNGPEAYWSEFHRRYPGSNGSIAFSSIGYSANSDLAVLLIDRGCGTLCGELSNVVVKRESAHWRVVLIQVKIMS